MDVERESLTRGKREQRPAVIFNMPACSAAAQRSRQAVNEPNCLQMLAALIKIGAGYAEPVQCLIAGPRCMTGPSAITAWCWGCR